MSVITKMLKGTCVYWGLKSNESGQLAYDDNGNPQVTSPVELQCRWVDKTKLFVEPNGEQWTSHSEVYVSSDVDVKGFLFNGELTDLTDQNVPQNNVGACEIRRFDKTPNFKQTEFLRKAFL
jgi:hypothetical protein